jgi:Fe-S-cluster containining protein
MFKKRRGLRKKLHEELYAQIPNMSCLPGCSDCCCIVRFSRHEVAQISTAKILRAIFVRFRQATTQKCPYLTKDKRCGIYPVRPFVCRLFGTSEIERLRCPKGMVPDNLLSVEESENLINQFLQIIDL